MLNDLAQPSLDRALHRTEAGAALHRRRSAAGGGRAPRARLHCEHGGNLPTVYRALIDGPRGVACSRSASTRRRAITSSRAYRGLASPGGTRTRAARAVRAARAAHLAARLAGRLARQERRLGRRLGTHEADRMGGCGRARVSAAAVDAARARPAASRREPELTRRARRSRAPRARRRRSRCCWPRPSSCAASGPEEIKAMSRHEATRISEPQRARRGRRLASRGVLAFAGAGDAQVALRARHPARRTRRAGRGAARAATATTQPLARCRAARPGRPRARCCRSTGSSGCIPRWAFWDSRYAARELDRVPRARQPLPRALALRRPGRARERLIARARAAERLAQPRAGAAAGPRGAREAGVALGQNVPLVMRGPAEVDLMVADRSWRRSMRTRSRASPIFTRRIRCCRCVSPMRSRRMPWSSAEERRHHERR